MSFPSTPITTIERMSDLSLLFSYEFVQNAIAAGLLASVLSGVVGTFVVVKRLVFIAGGISHAAFAGLGICYYLGMNPLIGAFVVAVLAALLLAWLGEGGAGRSQDAFIGILWAAGMAVGIVFIHLTPGYAPNLMAYLFGDILTVTRTDVYLLAVLVGAVLLVMALFYKELVAVSFDETFAQVQGTPVRFFVALLLVLVALSVILLIQVVGIVLLIALFTLPPVIALMLALRSFATVRLAAGLLAMLMTTGGLAGSYWLDLPSGPSIVLFGIAIGAVVRGVVWLRQRPRG
ncbi:MAG: metal ABC transporter permease [Ectothiorhodospiraceae bacterium]|nr:metal ABC transporter permease [Ectothiorhodospiraceae bacterium]